MSANLSALLYLVAGVLFILSLRGLSSPASSRQGNFFGMIGMAIAVATTLFALYYAIAGATIPFTGFVLVPTFYILGQTVTTPQIYTMIFLSCVLVLTFLLYPARGRFRGRVTLLDLVLCVASVALLLSVLFKSSTASMGTMLAMLIGGTIVSRVSPDWIAAKYGPGTTHASDAPRPARQLHAHEGITGGVLSREFTSLAVMAMPDSSTH